MQFLTPPMIGIASCLAVLILILWRVFRCAHAWEFVDKTELPSQLEDGKNVGEKGDHRASLPEMRTGEDPAGIQRVMKSFGRFDGKLWHREVGAAGNAEGPFYQQMCGKMITKNVRPDSGIAGKTIPESIWIEPPVVVSETDLCRECLAFPHDPYTSIYGRATFNIGAPPASEAYCRDLAMEVERLAREDERQKIAKIVCGECRMGTPVSKEGTHDRMSRIGESLNFDCHAYEFLKR